MKIEFIANPTQRKFIESRAEAGLFDCRKGEGKSAALVWACLFHTRENPGANSLFIRDTWENLRRTTLQEFFRWFPPFVFGDWRAGDKEYIWDEKKTGLKGRVMFMGVDDDASASKIASMPLAGVYIDEPSPAAGDAGVSEFVFDTCLAQLRQAGMNWYAMKLAQNNPDESHWTYRRFWEPGTKASDRVNLPPMQEPGFMAFQPIEAENVKNLPKGYYERMARNWAHRPDLLRRFVEGKHGFQQVGNAVTPEFSDDLHTAYLEPIEGLDLEIGWDGGQHPACVISQITPMGDWHILDAHVGDGCGMYELIGDVIKPLLTKKYRGFKWRHTGDPTLQAPDQSSSLNNAARLLRKELGGHFIPGPIKIESRVEPLRAVLRKVRNGKGIVQVDRENAKPVWHALRGGWHYHVSRGGIIGEIVKDEHSHPGDTCFPAGTMILTRDGERPIESIQVGDFVSTPFGERAVIASGITRYVDELLEITTSRQKKLICTPDHKVFTNNGFLRGDALRYGSILSNDKERIKWLIVRKLLNIMGISTGFRGVITEGTYGVLQGQATFIGPFGRIILEKFQMDAMSTIKTAIRSITRLKILSVLTEGFICLNTRRSLIHGITATEINSIYLKSEIKPHYGIEAKSGENGTRSKEKSHGRQDCEKGRQLLFVSSAGRNTKHTVLTKQDFAQKTAKQKIADILALTTKTGSAFIATTSSLLIAICQRERVASLVQRKCEGVPVYNLTVDQDHCYYANSILVSNCGYLCSLLYPLGTLRERRAGRRSRKASFFNPAGIGARLPTRTL